jgi:uncharacterized protein YjbI with pentapeptide repeats
VIDHPCDRGEPSLSWGETLERAHETDDERTRLRGAAFRSATLRGADFTGVDLTGADFNDADLEGVMGYSS